MTKRFVEHETDWGIQHMRKKINPRYEDAMKASAQRAAQTHFQLFLAYETANMPFLFSLVSFGWGQKIIGKYYAEKVQRKFGRLNKFLKMGAEAAKKRQEKK